MAIGVGHRRPGGAPRQDDRHAADGGGLQRRRWRCRGRSSRWRRSSGPRPGRSPSTRSSRSSSASSSAASRSRAAAIAFAKLQELMTGRPVTYPGQQVLNGIVAVAIIGSRDRGLRAARLNWIVAVVLGPRPGLRRRLRPAGRRGGRARAHLAAELVHGPRRGGERLRPALGRARRGRHPRRRLGHPAHPDDEPGDGALAAEHPLQRLRLGHHRHRRPEGDTTRSVKSASRRGRRHPARLRQQGDRRPRLRARRRPGPAHDPRARRPARGARRRGHLRHPPRRRPHARPHERPLRRGERALRAAEGDGRGEPRVRSRPTSPSSSARTTSSTRLPRTTRQAPSTGCRSWRSTRPATSSS